MPEDHWISRPEQLDALSGPIAPASRVKVLDRVHPHYAAMIAASPFALLATHGQAGLDISPRGDGPGFVKVEDPRTLLLPERRGNNRIDSLRNLVHDSQLALIFLIPGIGETLRVNGRARISVDPALLARFEVQGKPPKCVLVIAVNSVMFQCARAIHRSRLWQHVPQSAVPALSGTGALLQELTCGEIEAEPYDAALLQRQLGTLY